MRDLFSQCTYVRVCHTQECQFRTHLHSCACSGTHASRALTMEVEDRKKRCFLTMEDAEDSAAGPLQRTCAESSVECSRRLATLRKRKQQSQCTKEAKRAEENERKCKRKKHVVESSQVRYKLCSHSCLIQPYSP